MHYFWSLNVKQYAKHVRVYNQKQKEHLEELDSLNYLLGKYVAYAFNDPKHYPLAPFTQKNTELEPMTDEEMEIRGRRNTIRMGGVINDC